MDLEEYLRNGERYLYEFGLKRNNVIDGREIETSNEMLKHFFAFYLSDKRENLEKLKGQNVDNVLYLAEMNAIFSASSKCISLYGNSQKVEYKGASLGVPNFETDQLNRDVLIFGRLFEDFIIERKKNYGIDSVDYTKSLFFKLKSLSFSRIKDKNIGKVIEKDSLLKTKIDISQSSYSREYLGEVVVEYQMIGNEDFLNSLKTNIDYLLLYNNKEKDNVAKKEGLLPKVILIYGKPGTGKSLGVKHALAYAYKKACSIGKNIVYKSISNLDKTEYQNSFVTSLKPFFEDVKKGEEIYIIAVDEAESVFFARNNDRKNTEENKNVTEFMKFIEGIDFPYLGNYNIWLLTNYPEALDRALYQRCEEYIEVKGLQTIEDYRRCFRNLLNTQIQKGLIDFYDENKLYSLLLEMDINGRGCKNLTTNIKKFLACKEIPAFIFSLPEEKKIDYIFNKNKKITQKEIEKLVNEMKKN